MECYFCHRTIEGCKEYVESLKKKILSEHSNELDDDGKRKAEQTFDDICRYGMGSATVGTVNGPKGLIRIEVPICPVCERYMRTITNEICAEISNLENSIR